MQRLRALIFDVDGTLADTERDAHRVAFNRAFGEFSLPFAWDVPTYGKYLKITGGKERLRGFLNDHPQYPQLSDAEIRQIHQRKTALYGEIIAAGVAPLRPGVARLLDAAQAAGLRLAIATTTTPDNVSALLRSTLGAGAWERFDYIGAGDIVPHKKPAPDIYQHVLAQLQLSPAECLALEDSENGLRSALGAELAVVITQTEYTADQDFSGALCVLDHLGEVEQPGTVLAGNEAGQKLVVDLPTLEEWFARGSNRKV
jgi:HAD superfamily hydrolase (TIGR01509 family)